jgi:hypothetical protein
MEFFSRSDEEKSRTVYFISKNVMEVLNSSNASALAIVNAGVRAFSRQRGSAVSPNYRIHNEGCQALLSAMSRKRILTVGRSDLEALFAEEYPKFESFGKETIKAIKEMSKFFFILWKDVPLMKPIALEERSCCVFEYAHQPDPGQDPELFYFPIWLSGVSLSLLLSKPERESAARCLGVVNLIKRGTDKKVEQDKKDLTPGTQQESQFPTPGAEE